jgi:hypothetical protein
MNQAYTGEKRNGWNPQLVFDCKGTWELVCLAKEAADNVAPFDGFHYYSDYAKFHPSLHEYQNYKSLSHILRDFRKEERHHQDEEGIGANAFGHISKQSRKRRS